MNRIHLILCLGIFLLTTMACKTDEAGTKEATSIEETPAATAPAVSPEAPVEEEQETSRESEEVFGRIRWR